MDPQLVGRDADCYEMILTMLGTLNKVCVDELEAQGHTPECCASLLAVMNASGHMVDVVRESSEQMMARFGGNVNLTLIGDDLDFLGDESDED